MMGFFLKKIRGYSFLLMSLLCLSKLACAPFLTSNSKDVVVNSWKPYWMCLSQPKKESFFEANLGIGFLYAVQTRANFSPLPGNIANLFAGPAPFKRALIYNRAPLFEYLLGYRINPWLKGALSYQFQSGMTFQTEPLRGNGYSAAIPSSGLVSIFRANLSINSLQGKVIFEYPVPLIWKGVGFNPYLGVGLGACWQSFGSIEQNWIQTTTYSTSATIIEQTFRQKICPNVSYMVDVGLRVRNSLAPTPFFILLGAKYNQWGSVRNLGDLSEQGSQKVGLSGPFKVKTLYSFAPYLAVQWTFPESNLTKRVKKSEPFVAFKATETMKKVWTEFNAGIGFLYFNQIRGSLSSRPLDPLNGQPSQVPLKRGGVSYNRSPLSEFQLGFRLFPYLRVAMSYQHQSDVAFATQPENYENPNPALGLQRAVSTAQLKANLMLDAVMGKIYFDLPKCLCFKSFYLAPYLAFGLGPSWQTWTQVNVWRVTNSPNVALASSAQPLRDKICANAAWMADLGLRLHSADLTSPFSIYTGLKYLQWGQARNLGKMTQQNYRSFGLFPAFKIKTLYSFIPYLGVSWEYPIYSKGCAPMEIKGKNVNTYIPFLAPLRDLDSLKELSFEYNIGSGFLYFHKIRGVLSQRPPANGAGYSDIAPVKRQLSYNRSPLYEFNLGCHLKDWLKTSLSYQTQRNMSISTQFMKSSLPSEINNAVEFRANLKLDSLMIKCYFEFPYALIFKNLANTLYLGVGTGGCWQSWTQMEYRLATNGARRSQYYQQKICASVAFTVDAGFKVQSIFSKGVFCVTKGIKYMQWGQSRNLGSIKDQGSLNSGLFQPINIEVIYSFVPYIGIQWNY